MKRLSRPLASTILIAVTVCAGPAFGQKKKAAPPSVPPSASPSAPASPAPAPSSPPVDKETFLEDPFRLGSLLQDTNGDSIPDVVCGHIVVAPDPTAAENAAAANL